MKQPMGGKMGGKREENKGNQVESVKEKSHWPHTSWPHVHAFIALLINSQLVNSVTFICGTIKHFSTLLLMRWRSSLLLCLFFFFFDSSWNRVSLCVTSNMRSNDDAEESFYNNRQNPIISLHQLSWSGKMDLHVWDWCLSLRWEEEGNLWRGDVHMLGRLEIFCKVTARIFFADTS